MFQILNTLHSSYGRYVYFNSYWNPQTAVSSDKPDLNNVPCFCEAQRKLSGFTWYTKQIEIHQAASPAGPGAGCKLMLQWYTPGPSSLFNRLITLSLNHFCFTNGKRLLQLARVKNCTIYGVLYSEITCRVTSHNLGLVFVFSQSVVVKYEGKNTRSVYQFTQFTQVLYHIYQLLYTMVTVRPKWLTI